MWLSMIKLQTFISQMDKDYTCRQGSWLRLVQPLWFTVLSSVAKSSSSSSPQFSQQHIWFLHFTKFNRMCINNLIEMSTLNMMNEWYCSLEFNYVVLNKSINNNTTACLNRLSLTAAPLDISVFISCNNISDRTVFCSKSQNKIRNHSSLWFWLRKKKQEAGFLWFIIRVWIGTSTERSHQICKKAVWNDECQ